MDDITEIPKGFYCYDENGTCPYWSLNSERNAQDNGYCSFLKRGDWDTKCLSLLWDQVKECGINEYTDEELLKDLIINDKSLEDTEDIKLIIKERRQELDNEE